MVVDIQAGFGLIRRLDALGIRPGKALVKTSGSYMRGPVTVRLGNAQIALGFGMASKVILDVEAEPSK